jgi:hypothetical protein
MNAFTINPMIFPRNLCKMCKKRRKKVEIRVAMLMESYFSKEHKEERRSNYK